MLENKKKAEFLIALGHNIFIKAQEHELKHNGLAGKTLSEATVELIQFMQTAKEAKEVSQYIINQIKDDETLTDNQYGIVQDQIDLVKSLAEELEGDKDETAQELCAEIKDAMTCLDFIESLKPDGQES